MDSEVIKQIIEAHLPSHYEPLVLTFYGSDVQTNGNFLVFGNDYGTAICINPEDGSVYSVDPKHELPTRFLNTSVKCLAKFLATHQRYQTEVTKNRY